MSGQGVDEGEKVIAASKRPDGTYRKERRVRAGYVPQDEQPIYQSKGALFKQNVPKCPGLDEADVAKKPMSKAAKKNAKRKEKKQSEESNLDAATQSMGDLSVSETPSNSDKPPGLSGTSNPVAEATSIATRQNDASSNNSASAATMNAVTTAADVLQNSGGSAPASQDTEKQLRNLRKKIRQAEATAKKAAEGKQLTPEEEEKLTRLKQWQAEEARLAA